MKALKCTSDFIYFIDDDELYSNRVSYELIANSPVDAQDIAQKRVGGWYKVELALGEDLNELVPGDYEDDSWYIVGGQGPAMGIRLKDPSMKLRKYEALISF